VAVTHPERVARLVLSGSPAGSLPTQVAVGLQAAVRPLADPVPADFVREFQAGATHLPLPETFLEGLVAESGKLPARVWRDAADGLATFDDTADLERIAVPTLLVWGDRDGLLPPQEQQRLAGAIPGARSQLYPETGHSPHWERPERFTADLDAFMRAG
jgi:non-heme chloroperoxidase